MAKHNRWTNRDLISKMIQANYRGYKELDTFLLVLCNGEFYSVSLIQNGESQRKCDGYAWYFETVRVITFSSKEEGNRFYKSLKATERTSRKNTYYYALREGMI